MNFKKIIDGNNENIYIDLDEVLFFNEYDTTIMFKNGETLKLYIISKLHPTFQILQNYFEEKQKNEK